MHTSSRPSLLLLLPLTSALLLSGCHTGPRDGVVATVNGHPIQSSDVEKFYQAQIANNAETPTPDMAEAQHLQIVESLILDEIVDQRAAKLGLTATNDEVDAKLNEMKAPFTEEQFNDRLKASNHTLDDVKHDLRRSLTQEKLLNKEINSKITVSDADVNAYFNAHKAEFNNPDNEYHLAQILVSNAPSPNGNTNLQGNKAANDSDAKKKIQAIKNRLDTGDDFGSLAMNFSESPQTAANGGDMGQIPETQLKSNPGVFAAISRLHAGQDTDIIPFPSQTNPQQVGGYAIFRLLDKAQAGQRDLNDPRVQQQIRQQLHDSRSNLLKAAYREMIRDQAKVENFMAEQIFKDSAR